MMARTIALIGAPTDIGAGHRGASMGPEALRVAGIEAALVQRGCSVLDTGNISGPLNPWQPPSNGYRSEEHTSELQSPMRISYAVFCLKKKTQIDPSPPHDTILI